MKNLISLIACFIITSFYIQYRQSHINTSEESPTIFTQWDGLGYYMYLPSAFIYNDFTNLDWMDKMDNKYSLTGGELYQAHKHENGNYVNKYLGGVAIMQAPLFAIGHVIALNSDYPADGFSPPYQLALAYGVLLYCLLALFLLRKILLRYFDDLSVAICLILMFLATNLVQYIPIEAGQSHPYIFPLYVLVLYTTIKWHEKPRVIFACLTGLIIGLATICRPTEAIMFLIPLLWSTHSKESKAEKWALVKVNKKHILCAIVFGIIGILPQLIYWKMTAGTFVHDVGSSWRFLTPSFRSLFGWEIGWFIYTPITILFVAGFFFMKKFPFRRSVIIFCLLNIWIIISWADWRYGATYSSRAMVQSFPIFALPFTAVIERINVKKWKFLFYGIGLYFIFVNLFQIEQYNNKTLHFRDMNRMYYSRIYLNSNPNPLDMSLLDTDEVMNNEKPFDRKVILSSTKTKIIGENALGVTKIKAQDCDWVKIKTTIKADQSFQSSYIKCRLSNKQESKTRKIRLFSPISQIGQFNNYCFYMKIPNTMIDVKIEIFIDSKENFTGQIRALEVTHLTSK